jgi:polyhydroxybutyrate depolymerase
MKTRKVLLVAVGVIIGLPVLLVFIAALSFYAFMSSYAPNRINGAILSSGQRRQYLLYVPRSYNRANPTPLVISLHAAALWPATQAALSQWSRLADAHGFIVVYPSGTTLNGSATGMLPFRVWLSRPDAVLLANVDFIAELIDTLQATYNIDRSRIYANGFSNGGAMVFALSCRLSHRIAAVGTVSAAQDQPWSWCNAPRPIPLINFHGTADLVPYNGGTVWASPRPFPSVLTWTAEWARKNHCRPRPIEATVASEVTRLQYLGCADSAAVVLYTIRGGGHAWPGGKPLLPWLLGPTSRRIDATSLMWQFFREHPLPRQ